MKTAVRIPTGTPRTSAPPVTYTEPRIIGRIPNLPLPGFQIFPNRKSMSPISRIAGMLFPKRKAQISRTAAIEAQAESRNTSRISGSRTFSWAYSVTSDQSVISPV